MKNIKYLLSSFHFYVVTILIAAISIAIISIFVENHTMERKIFNALENSNLRYIAFEEDPVNVDSYEYFGGEPEVSLIDDNFVNALVYQQIEGVTYTDMSPYNPKNLLNKGDGVLKENEVAIPDYYHYKYGININDHISVNGKSILVKHIFYDVGTLYDINFKTTAKIIFLGPKTIVGDVIFYGNFHLSTKTHHLNTKSIVEEKNIFKIKLIETQLLVMFISLFIGLFMYYFKFKIEYRSFNTLIINGGRKVTLKIIFTELIYFLIVSSLVILFTFWNDYIYLTLFSLLGILISQCVYVVLFILSLKEKKKWKYGSQTKKVTKSQS